MIADPPPSPGSAGIYLHFPFCARRCSYCDFPTVVGLDTERLGRRYDLVLRHAYRAAWDRGAAAGLIRWDGSRVRLTGRGRICSNELFAELLAA
jgi:coproporphyrinogen III oxidase-like Fe-S oxidoreductase